MEKEGCSCCAASGGAGRVWQSIGGALDAHEVSSYLHCFPPHPAVELDVSQALSNIPERLHSRASLYKSLLELMPQGGQKGSWQGAGSDEGRAMIRIHAPTLGCSLGRERSVSAALSWVLCSPFTPTPQIFFETCDFREPQLGAIHPTNVFFFNYKPLLFPPNPIFCKPLNLLPMCMMSLWSDSIFSPHRPSYINYKS